ncbi:MAG: hypothetical protein AAGL69_00920 [Pseudomonadota bacterium]
MLRPAWLGQTTASACWIASMMLYGLSSAGDWLQLTAASAWLFANLAELLTDASTVSAQQSTAVNPDTTCIGDEA